MKKLILIILILFAIGNARADYASLNLYTLVLRAEKIIEGEVICVDDKVFEFKVKNSIDFEEETITIKKFEDWTCAIRWSKYYVGQKLFVFLGRNEEGYYAMGAGNEGELPIINNSVYINAVSLPFKFEEYIGIVPKPEYAKEDIRYFLGYEVAIKNFWEYTLHVRKCFEFELNDYRRIKSANYVCSKDNINSLRESSRIFDWTFYSLLN